MGFFINNDIIFTVAIKTLCNKLTLSGPTAVYTLAEMKFCGNFAYYDGQWNYYDMEFQALDLDEAQERCTSVGDECQGVGVCQSCVKDFYLCGQAELAESGDDYYADYCASDSNT